MPHHLAVGSLLLFAGLAHAPTGAAESAESAESAEASAEATRYLEVALDQIEKGSRVQLTDWIALRAKALATISAAAARTTADTYPAIRDALATLGDKHALLLDPDAAKRFNPPRATTGTGLLVAPDAIVAQVLPGSPAAMAGLALGDRVVAVAGVAAFAELPRREFERLFRTGRRLDGSTAPLELRVSIGTAKPRGVKVPLAQFDEYQAPTGCMLDGGFGYVELPGVSSGPKAASYDDALHELFGELDDGDLRGFIVDLRRNTGGTLWPMLAGVGPLVGEGKVGAFTSGHGGADWSYDAKLGIASSETYELAKVAKPYPLLDDLPVAVLTGPLTAGFGEAIAVAFAGRDRARRFGEGTRSQTTSNTQIPLADGALLVLTVTVHADRHGTRYEDGIQPDEKVATDWSRFGATEDPVIAAASRWLESETDAR